MDDGLRHAVRRRWSRWAAASAWTFDARPRYVWSLAYLAVFGSVVAFGAYFTLLKRVGAGPSSYIARRHAGDRAAVSTLFEGYRWTWVARAGVVLAVLGNWLALRPGSEAEPRARDGARYSSSSFASAISFFQLGEVGLDDRAEPLRRARDDLRAFPFSSRSLTSGCASTRFTSALSFATISRGVPAGATMPQ